MTIALTGTEPRVRVEELRRVVLDTLRPMLEGIGDYALIDAPNYPNVGDSAIYLGQLACLRELGLPAPRFVCDFRTYDRGAVARAIGTGPILLTGGGSFGDLWPTGQRCREEILRSFPRNRIVQLPQTLHFKSEEALRRARDHVNGHPDFTLLVRDRGSLAFATSEFQVRAALCPDMAFCLGPLTRVQRSGRPILCLLRGDQSSAWPEPGSLPGDCRRADWITERGTALRALSHRLIGVVRLPRVGRFFRPGLMALYERLATQRLRRGLRLLGSAEVAITDRLHGHILALLLGVPQVVIDDRHGKVSSFHAAWTAGVARVRSAESPAQAIMLARELLGTPEPAPTWT